MALFPNGFMPAIQNNSQTLLATGLGLLAGPTGPQQAAMAAQGFASGMQASREKQAVNATVAWLQKVNPQLAEIVKTGGMSPADAYKEQLKAQMPDYMAVGKRVFDKRNGKFLDTGAGSAETPQYGMSPIFMQDDKGNVIVGQLGDNNTLSPSRMPDQYKVMSPYDKSYQTTQGSENAKTTAEAQGQIGSMRQIAQSINFQIKDLKDDPYLPNMLGPWDSRMPNVSSNAARVQSKINQLQGGAFLQARQLLKGGGQITDYEGQKAEQAFIRLNTAQKPEDFKAALDEFNYWVQEGLKKLEAQANGQGANYQPTPMGGGSSGAPDPLGIR